MNTKILSLAILSLSFYFTACVPTEANNNNSEELSKKQQEIDKLTKELNDAKTKIKTGTSGAISQTDYDKALKSVKEKEKALLKLTQEKEALEKQIKNTPAVATVDSNQVAELQGKLASLQQEKETVDNVKKSLEKAALENTQKINNLEEEIKKNELNIRQKEEQINSLNETLTNNGVNAKQLNELNEQKDQLEKANLNLTQAKSALETEKNQLEEANQTLTQEKSALETEKTKLEEAKLVLETEKNNINQELIKLKEKEQLATIELQQVKKDLELAQNNAQAAVIPQIINDTLSKVAKDALFASAVSNADKNMQLLVTMFDDNNVDNEQKIKLVTKIIKDKNTTDEVKSILKKASTVATTYTIANTLLTTIVDNPSEAALEVLTNLLITNDNLTAGNIKYALTKLLPLVKTEGDDKFTSKMIKILIADTNKAKLDALNYNNASQLLTTIVDNPSEAALEVLTNLLSTNNKLYAHNIKDALTNLLPLVKNEGDDKFTSKMIKILIAETNKAKLDSLDNDLANKLLTTIIDNPSEAASKVLTNLLTTNNKLTMNNIKDALNILKPKVEDKIIKEMKESLTTKLLE